MEKGFYLVTDSIWNACSNPNETVMMAVLVRLWSMYGNKPFKTKNKVMAGMCKMSEKTVRRVKQSLKEKGLIDYKSSEGKMTEYTLLQEEEKKTSKNVRKALENREKKCIITKEAQAESEKKHRTFQAEKSIITV